MTKDSHFKRAELAPTLEFTFAGERYIGCEGDTVATALLANGIHQTQHNPADASPRGPFCMMGMCYECLVSIDGIDNKQACMEPLLAGMCVLPMSKQ